MKKQDQIARSPLIRPSHSRENSHDSGHKTRSCASTDSIPKIQDYGIIGDCRAAALISCYGSIEWLCWPRFDKPSIFAALLDRASGGEWRISPPAPYRHSRHYISETNVLQTVFETDAGAMTLTDLMPMDGTLRNPPTLLPDHEILRHVECTRGECEVQVAFMPRCSYGLHPAVFRKVGCLGFRVEVGRGVYWLRGTREVNLVDGSLTARIHLRAGETLTFSLSYAEESPTVLTPLDGDLVEKRIQLTVDCWRQWARIADYDGSYRDDVVRSALTLKLLSYAPSGAIVAAPTTSLPEKVGGDLNWDYRYCWLRDASLTIRALLELGYWQEADDFMDWMLQATRLTQPQLRVLYDMYGNKAPRERELSWLDGYRQSRPVRVGNAARHQRQLDVYGEVIDAAAQYASRGRPLDRDMQKALKGFGGFVLKHWNEPDEGIWEPRSGPKDHTHSRLLCWVALDRLITLHEAGKLKGAPVDEYRSACEKIKDQVKQRGWNSHVRSYVSVLDGSDVDSSLLLLSWYGFEKADSSRMRHTYQAILDRLGTTHGLLYRYRSSGTEGTFALCSFWEAEFLALGGGSLARAHALFNRLLAYRNDLGLYAEEIDPRSGDALGNFPQAFTHIGLIGAALSIRQREKGEQQLTHRPDEAETSHASMAA